MPVLSVALNKYEDAVRSFDAIIERYPEDATAWYEKGLALYRLEKYQESLATLEKARTLDPENNDALYHLAASQLALGNVS